jgi:hypothetical protein
MRAEPAAEPSTLYVPKEKWVNQLKEYRAVAIMQDEFGKEKGSRSTGVTHKPYRHRNFSQGKFRIRGMYNLLLHRKQRNGD